MVTLLPATERDPGDTKPKLRISLGAPKNATTKMKAKAKKSKFTFPSRKSEDTDEGDADSS